MPGFRCLHSHCDSRGIKDLVEWAEGQKTGIIAARCANLRVWAPGNTNSKGRPRIELPSLGRAQGEFGKELGEKIGPTLDLFQFSNNVVEITTIPAADKKGAIPGHMLSTLRPTELVTAVERTVETGVIREDDAGDSVFVPKSMSEADARITLVSGFFGSRLPRIRRVLDVPVPHLSDDGKLVYPKPRYDERFGTWLNPHAPQLRTMGLTEALNWIYLDLFGPAEQGGFWWHDEQARVHAIARFITPFCRGLMDWNRPPLWIFDGNREGCGKDTCADITHLAYTGRSIICAPLSKECDDEMRKRITSALMAGSRFFHLANMKGHVRYASLEAATDNSGVWEDRRLGVSETLSLPNETEFSFSANNATWEPDIERRCRRIRLRFTPEDINGHRYRHADIRGWVRRHRAELLSAVAAMVNEWVRQGCPPGPSPFTSFPEWGQVVGGILTCAGLPDPCRPHEDSQVSGDQATKAMREFFDLAFTRFGDREVLKKEFQEFVQQDESVHELFDWLDFAARRGLTSFGKLMAKFDKRELGGITFRFKQTSKNYGCYRFFREGEGILPLCPTPSNSDQPSVGRRDIVGHFHTGCIGGLNSDEKNKNEGELNSLYRSDRKTSHNVPTSHNGVFCSLRSDLDRIALDLAGADRIALDIETYGPRKGDGLDPWKGDIRLLTLSRHGGTIWTIDLRATGYDLGPLKPILEETGIIAHNAKFDLLWLWVKCGLFATRVHCTLTAARILAAGTKPGNNLDQCLERYLQIKPAADHSRSDWASMLLTDDQLAYAARDVAYLHDLLGVMETDLELSGLDIVWALESALLPTVVKMEATGIRVERGKLEAIAAEADRLAQQATADLRVALGNQTINPGSPAQLLAALRAKGISLESTAEEALKAADDGTIIPLVLTHREASKRAQQAEALVGHIQSDGRIHGRFEPLGTATGRFSSKEPNLQNVGRGEMREAFTAPEGRRLIVADYSQIELRAAAAIAGETRMIEAYQAGADLHKRTAATVLGKPEDEVTKDDRQLSKACFSGDTEILTPRGWVRLENYDGTTPVAQFALPEGIEWNPPRPRSNRWGHPTGKVHYHGDGEIQFVRPLAFRSFEDRELFRHEDRNTDLLLTGDHQVVFISNNGNPIKRAAIDVTPGNCRHFIAAGTMARQKPTARMEAFTRTLAMVVADGYFSTPRCVHFGFSKQRKIERCLKLLGELGLTPRISVSGRVTSIRVTNEDWVESLLSWITIKKDLSWRCLTALPTDIYLDEAGYWDSYLIVGNKRNRALFCTTSKQTAQVMQAMAATSGIPSLLRHEPRTNEKHSDVWHLSYIHKGPPTWRASWNLKPTGRNERVWCVQVPSGAILIRRNGKVCVQGNCNFGLLYGQSAPGLVRYAATSYGVTMTGDQATDIRQAFFRTYSRLRQWHGLSHQQAEAGVTEVRTRAGRRRLILSTATDWERFTALVNTPVQGGTADGMKHALILIDQRLPKSARIVSTVHDEVVVECHEGTAEQCREIITTAMVEAMAALFPEVPVEVEANICTTWAEK